MRTTEQEKPQFEYSVYLEDKVASTKLGLVKAEGSLVACQWAVKRHRAFLKKLGAGNYKLVVTNLRTEVKSTWSLDSMLQPGATAKV